MLYQILTSSFNFLADLERALHKFFRIIFFMISLFIFFDFLIFWKSYKLIINF